MRRPTVVIADDHLLVSEALRSVLAADFDVIGVFTDGMAVVEGAPALAPDVIVLDIGMPLLNGLDAGRELKRLVPKAKLIYVTMNNRPSLVTEAFKSGASGYVLKQSAISELSQCLREVLRGGRYVSPSIAAKAEELKAMQPNAADHGSITLTQRQRQIVQLIAEGRTMKEIGALLNISPRTVAEHKYNIMDTLLLKSSAELVQYAIKQGIVQI